eukprot:1507724-Rhodomonas_salina.1
MSGTALAQMPLRDAVLTARRLLRCYGAGARCALSGTELAYAATCPYAMSGTELAYAATCPLRDVRY